MQLSLSPPPPRAPHKWPLLLHLIVVLYCGCCCCYCDDDGGSGGNDSRLSLLGDGKFIRRRGKFESKEGEGIVGAKEGATGRKGMEKEKELGETVDIKRQRKRDGGGTEGNRWMRTHADAERKAKTYLNVERKEEKAEQDLEEEDTVEKEVQMLSSPHRQLQIGHLLAPILTLPPRIPSTPSETPTAHPTPAEVAALGLKLKPLQHYQRLYTTSLLYGFPVFTALSKPYPYVPTSVWQLTSPCCEVPYNTTGRWNGTAWT
eukprot:GHVQ01031732.1.p1 GENE.GHVQ01031732.1~~GHVQ01031732.1.p1  ORF type:complete len:260 (+),score=51.63 GHVQ01031732.1:749-1528(+)